MIGGLAVWLWFGRLDLGMVVGVALGLNFMVAGSVGTLVPLLLRKVGADLGDCLWCIRVRRNRHGRIPSVLGTGLHISAVDSRSARMWRPIRKPRPENHRMAGSAICTRKHGKSMGGKSARKA